VGNGSFFPGVKQPGREADRSPLSKAKERMELYLHFPTCLQGMMFNEASAFIHTVLSESTAKFTSMQHV
jgi:hypothetical protein